MAKIYSAPESLKTPELDFSEINGYEKACEKYVADLKEILVKRKPGKNVGEVIGFPVADGQAQYMVASMKPVELIHLPLMDAWHFEYANRLTAKDVQDKINQEKLMDELFSKKG
jgi:hypothetical protein